MGDFILVLNAGSSSLKFTLFECFGEALRTAYGGQIEGLFTEPLFKAKDAAGRVAAEEAWPAGTPFGHDGALEALFAWGRTILGGGDRIAAVGHRVVHAVGLFVYRINRELGSLAAALGGLDSLVFTAGIGEHAPVIRERVCRSAAWLGLEFDECANMRGGPMISRPGSRVRAWVIPTDEELMIARHTQQAVLAKPS